MHLPWLEQVVGRSARRVGLQIKRAKPGEIPLGSLPAMLGSNGIELLLDVGANTGQFARTIRALGYRGRIVSFEPLLSAHELLSRSSAADPQWTVAPRCAVGDREGEIELHVAGNSVSSSVLGMLRSHADAAPESQYVGSERVRLATLDQLAASYMAPGTPTFLKIDTQGYEDKVLDGASAVLATARGLQLELSLLPLYEGQQLFDALLARLRSLGFELWAISPGFSDARSGRMLQVDATLFRG